MLPLYPELKARLEQLLRDIAYQAAQSRFGPFADTPRVRQHEGDRLEYMTIDGDEKATDYQRMAVGFDIKPSDIPGMAFEDAVQLVTAKGLELGTQEANRYLQVLNQSVEEVGNAIDAEGQTFTVDLYLKMLERVKFPFDNEGNPLLPTMHIGPDLEASVKQVMQQAQGDADARARIAALIDERRKEWNAEQDRRKLVD
jgi:hypothetical protein